MPKGYLLVEGHGEVNAAGNLVARLTIDLGLELTWAPPMRWVNLHRREGLVKGAEYVRRHGDASALLLLRDEDDACPRERGPELAGWLAALRLPFPAAVVLLRPEQEVLFLPCLPGMAGREINGRPGLRPGTAWDGASWESHRRVKERLSRHYPPNRSYKPTVDQLPLTRMVELEVVRAAGVPCFGTLERALTFLGRDPKPGDVYPRLTSA